MEEDSVDAYNQGYRSFINGGKETSNPFTGLAAEYWLDGYEDAQDDEEIRGRKSLP